MECELKSRFSDQMNLFCGGYSEQTIEKVDVVTYIFFNTVHCGKLCQILPENFRITAIQNKTADENTPPRNKQEKMEGQDFDTLFMIRSHSESM